MFLHVLYIMCCFTLIETFLSLAATEVFVHDGRPSVLRDGVRQRRRVVLPSVEGARLLRGSHALLRRRDHISPRLPA